MFRRLAFVLLVLLTAGMGPCDPKPKPPRPDGPVVQPKLPDFVEREAQLCRSMDQVETQVLDAGGIQRGERVGTDQTVASYTVREWSQAAIVQNADGCAFAIHGPIFAAYKRAGNILGSWRIGPFEKPIWQPHPLGMPMTDVVATQAGDWIALTNGFITHRADVGAHFFSGRIAELWRARNGLDGLGPALRDQIDSKIEIYDVTHCDFEKASAWVRSPGEGEPVLLPPPVSQRWEGLVPVPHFRWPFNFTGNLAGRRVDFESNGAIFMRPDRRAVAVWGPILARYNQLGGQTGPLGYPVGELAYMEAGTIEYVRFEHGTLCRARLTDAIRQTESPEQCLVEPPPLLEVGTYPDDSGFPWSEQIQGVAHDANAWFFTTRESVWRIPVNQDLDNVRMESHTTVMPPGYNHLGDLDHKDGILYVPLLGPKGHALGIWDSNLQYLGELEQPGLASDSPWVAFNPVDGLLYASTFNTTSLIAYQVDTNGERPLRLRVHHTVQLRGTDGAFLTQGFWAVQGGTFSPNGILYLAVEGYRIVDESRFDWNMETGSGVMAVDVTTGRIKSRNFVEYVPGRFHVPIEGWVDDGDEFEGMDYWDLDDGRAPGIRGQLHLLILDNDFHYDDDLFFKHYTARPPAQP